MSMIQISKPYIGEAEKKAVMEVLESGNLAQGTQVERLEAKFADYCKVKHAVAVSSGTSGLILALLAHQIGPGDEVITTPFTFIASINSILFVGAKPVFVDVDPETFNLNPDFLENAVTPRTKAIMPVHLYGYMCNMDMIMMVAKKNNLTVIEDACQAVSAKFKGQYAGSFGTGVFSLYATKNITAGEGGMITTNYDEIADTCKLLRNHGMQQRYHHELLGLNFRMSDLHGAIGLAQMDRLGEVTRLRQENARYYDINLKSVETPTVKEGYEHVYHQYTVRIRAGRDRDQVVDQLKAAQIGTGIYYPIPAHQQPYVKDIVGKLNLPVAEQLAREVISIPVHPLLSEKDKEKIVVEINKI